MWQVDRPYFSLPGYYYLHRDVPLYDMDTVRLIGPEVEEIRACVSHIVTGDASTAVPGYSVEREFGGMRVMRADDNAGDVRQWEALTPTSIDDPIWGVMKRIASNPPPPPRHAGIRFLDRDPSGGQAR